MRNEYENEDFFQQYAQMSRSREGLSAAGEWHQLKPLFPPLEGKSVLDLGCGYGWHCQFAVEQGARPHGTAWFPTWRCITLRTWTPFLKKSIGR